MKDRLSIDEAFDIVCKRLDDYDTFMLMVKLMRKAQKDANDMIAQAECYQEAMDYVRKAEELEKEVDAFLDKQGL